MKLKIIVAIIIVAAIACGGHFAYKHYNKIEAEPAIEAVETEPVIEATEEVVNG